MPPLADLRAVVINRPHDFQPIVDLNTARVVGAETLVRFVNPDGTVRGPGGLIERSRRNSDESRRRSQRVSLPLDGRKCRAAAGPVPRFYISAKRTGRCSSRRPGSSRSSTIRVWLGNIDRRCAKITERQALTDAGRGSAGDRSTAGAPHRRWTISGPGRAA
jgi:hypothetical protein